MSDKEGQNIGGRRLVGISFVHPGKTKRGGEGKGKRESKKITRYERMIFNIFTLKSVPSGEESSSLAWIPLSSPWTRRERYTRRTSDSGADVEKEEEGKDALHTHWGKERGGGRGER